jgi:CIC family chloride channel protein
MIGIISGISAVGVSFLTTLFTSIFLGAGAGYVPPLPGILQNSAYPSLIVERPWMLPIITCLGGLAVGLFFYKIQPKGEGHGTDAVIDAFHNKQGKIPSRVPFLTALASPITIGTGGSGGLEGPMSQIGAGFSSILGRLFKFDTDDRRIAVAAGLAAGIGSIFKVPLGAALFSTEVFYRQDFEVKALVPAVIAAVSGYTVVGFVTGWAPIFSLPPDAAKYSHPESLLLYGIIGIISAAASMAYVRTLDLQALSSDA